MSEKIAVLLADTDPAERLSLREALEATERFRVVAEADDGRQALALTREHHPQIVITDLWLRGTDGLSLLDSLRQMEQPPWTIILSSFCADHILAEAARRGAFYCMAKPVDSAALIERMLLAVRTPQTTTLPITRYLHAMSAPHGSRGFRCLEVAIRLGIEDADILNAMVKELYPAVAAEVDSTPARVEIEMRRTIAVIWQNGDPEILERCFPHARRRPTNSAFISTMADILRPIFFMP